MTCGNQSRVVGVPVVAEPTVAPVPPVAVPVEVTNVEAAIGVAVNRAPEEHDLTLPLLRDEMLVFLFEEEVQHIGIVRRKLCKFLAELVTLDYFAVLLAFIEMEHDLRHVPLDDSALLMFLDRPAVGDIGDGVEVDHVFDGLDFRTTEQGLTDLTEETLTLAEHLDLFVRPVALATESELDFIRLTNIEHECTHCFFLWTMSRERPRPFVAVVATRCLFLVVTAFFRGS